VPTRSRAIDCFRQRETVCIVAHAHSLSERTLEILRKRPTVQISRIGVSQEARGWRDRSGRPDTETIKNDRLCLNGRHEIANRFERRPIISWRRDSLPDDGSACKIKDSRFDLRATEVDAEHEWIIRHGTITPVTRCDRQKKTATLSRRRLLPA
jgi:hypothetical protein